MVPSPPQHTETLLSPAATSEARTHVLAGPSPRAPSSLTCSRPTPQSTCESANQLRSLLYWSWEGAETRDGTRRHGKRHAHQPPGQRSQEVGFSLLGPGAVLRCWTPARGALTATWDAGRGVRPAADRHPILGTLRASALETEPRGPAPLPQPGRVGRGCQRASRPRKVLPCARDLTPVSLWERLASLNRHARPRRAARKGSSCCCASFPSSLPSSVSAAQTAAGERPGVRVWGVPSPAPLQNEATPTLRPGSPPGTM
ncbi:uncharacterized protein LOC104864121 [Fukomys damarensis]|uniref:uncharacterized protein LOC104864121 n=1 Tax=Fukomys damarensis TaxID=885580 RepID=UPI00053F8099|nr:uncharacterized protein LOC104864121 [Fukomys damarensis]